MDAVRERSAGAGLIIPAFGTVPVTAALLVGVVIGKLARR
jgi:hypothetical protein